MGAPSNLAYEYNRFEERKIPHITKTTRKPRKKQQAATLFKAICAILVVITMLSALIYTQVVQAELGTDYNQAVKQLNELKGENSRLQIKMEQDFSQDAIEQIAREKLQMSELDSSKIEYIEFNNHDKAEVIKKISFFDTVMGWINGLFQ